MPPPSPPWPDPRPPRGGPRARRLLAQLALLAAAGCSTSGKLGLATFVSAAPGRGGGVALEQLLATPRGGRLDFELGAERQALDEEGPRGDDFTRAFLGARLGPAAGQAGLGAHCGISWIRSLGMVGALDPPGDFGGAHLGLGWSLPLGAHGTTGPELVLLYVDAEGDQGGSGALLEFTWRVTLRP